MKNLANLKTCYRYCLNVNFESVKRNTLESLQKPSPKEAPPSYNIDVLVLVCLYVSQIYQTSDSFRGYEFNFNCIHHKQYVSYMQI